MNSSNQFTKIARMLILSLVIFLPLSIFGQDGETTFKNVCGACHTIGKGRLVGPDLAGVTKKRNEAWLMKWVKSSTSLIASGDVDAKTIFDQYKIPMPDQPNLSDDQIKAVLAYITKIGDVPPVPVETAKVIAPTTSVPVNESLPPAILFENPLMYLYIFLGVFIAVVIYTVWNAKRILNKNGKSFRFSIKALNTREK